MKKTSIVILLASSIWGTISSPLAPPVNAQTQPNAQLTTVGANTTKLELLTAGAEPRQEIKFRPVVNSKQTLVMTMDMTMATTIGETPLPATPLPKMSLKIDAIVRSVDPVTGDITCSFRYDELQAIADKTVAAEVLAAVQKSLKSMAGTRLDLVMSSNGKIKSKNLTLPKNLDPMLKQTLSQIDRSMEQLSTNLPQEKIGLGAKWRTSDTMQVAGTKFELATLNEVVELSATGMTIKTQIAQSAPPQDLIIPNLGTTDIKGKILSVMATGESRFMLRFDSLLPISGRSAIKSDSKTLIQSGTSEPTNMSAKVSIDLNISSK